MSDSSDRTNATRERAGSPLAAGLTLLAVLFFGIGAFAVWRNSVSPSNDLLSQNWTATSTKPIDIPSPTTTNATPPTINELQQTVAALQSTQRQLLNEIETVKQKIDAEQGERKLLTNQIGSLSVRLDELSAASASIAEGASTRQSQKRRAKGR